MAKKSKVVEAAKHSETPAKTFDPSLAALFEQSSGPVSIPKRAVANASQRRTVSEKSPQQGSIESVSVASDASLSSDESKEQQFRPRKRRRIDSSLGLEADYLNRLVRQDRKDQEAIQKKTTANATSRSPNELDADDKISDTAGSPDSTNGEDDPPLHEVLGPDHELVTPLRRTVFLGNVSTDAIKSKTSRKVLLKHLSALGEDSEALDDRLSIESLRFRSTAFATGVGPKKAAYAKKELMDQTTKSTNAYIVYNSDSAAKQAASNLNGTIVLGRHLRVDYLGDPAKVDHRRCVFVGNLSFVDKEADNIHGPNAEENPQRLSAKEPADAEEGLWRVFSKAGKVESVRVVRDKDTRVGKGIAYVQFADENAVEAALLMHEKKFPPLLPRKLRVMRAKQVKRNTGTMMVQKRAGPRAHKRIARERAAGVSKKPKSMVFEGARATRPTKPQVRAQKKRERKAEGRLASKPKNRGTRRAEAFKAAGGKVNRSSQD